MIVLRLHKAALLAILLSVPSWAIGQVGTMLAKGPNSIVLDVWPQNGWTVEQFENLVEVRFPNSDLEIVAQADLVETIGPLLQAVDVDVLERDTVLRLTLNCDCPVAITGDGGESLELSIIGSTSADQTGMSSIPTGSSSNWPPIPPKKPSTREVSVDPAVNSRLNVDEARARLLEQLMRAADAGLVELSTEPQDDLGEISSENSNAPSVDNDAISSIQEVPASPHVEEPDIFVDTSLSDGSAKEVTESPSSESTEAKLEKIAPSSAPDPEREPKCHDDQSFDFPEFVNSNEFIDEIASLRSALLGEFDAIQPQVAVDLARAYLSNRFEHEARLILEKLPKNVAEANLVKEIAQVLLGEKLPGHSDLLKADCAGPQSIWRAVALASEESTYEEALQAELLSGRAIEALPQKLREIASSRIGLAAANIGEWDTARRMQAMAVRAAAGAQQWYGATLLLSAVLADWNGDSEAAWQFRQTALGVEPPYSDLALLEMGETVFGSEKFLGAVTDALELDLGQLALRERGNELGRRAFDLEVRLQARVHGRDAVVELLSQGADSGILQEDEQVELLSEVIDDPQLAGLSRPLGIIYLEDPERFEGALTQPGFRKAVVKSLAELGLPSLAEPLLEDHDRTDQSVLMALSDAYLSSGDARGALDVAHQLPPGGAKDAKMATAFAALGESARAAVLMKTLDSVFTKNPDPQENALENALDAAAVEGDMAGAMQAASTLLKHDPTQRRAEQVVMLALMARARSIPGDAHAVLKRTSPARADELSSLFQPVSEFGGVIEASQQTEALKRIDVELDLLEGILTDG